MKLMFLIWIFGGRQQNEAVRFDVEGKTLVDMVTDFRRWNNTS